MIYPETISVRLSELRHARATSAADATGTDASFSCGSAVIFSLQIDNETITDFAFSSNGCGYMMAAADVIAEDLINKRLVELSGLSGNDLREKVTVALGDQPSDRRECIDSCINAVRATLGNLRSRRISEYAGETALICTCFGVTETRIVEIVEKNDDVTLDDISAECNAGSGCGSCRMMIEEIIDGVRDHDNML